MDVPGEGNRGRSHRIDPRRMPNPRARARTHALHLGVTAEVVRGQNHSEWVHIKALCCSALCSKYHPGQPQNLGGERRGQKETTVGSTVVSDGGKGWDSVAYLSATYTRVRTQDVFPEAPVNSLGFDARRHFVFVT